jgi:hypothetical protein
MQTIIMYIYVSSEVFMVMIVEIVIVTLCSQIGGCQHFRRASILRVAVNRMRMWLGQDCHFFLRWHGPLPGPSKKKGPLPIHSDSENYHLFSQFCFRPVTNIMVLKRAIFLTIPVHCSCCSRSDSVSYPQFMDLSDHFPFSQFHVHPVTILEPWEGPFFSDFLFTSPIGSDWILSLLPLPRIWRVGALLCVAL